MTPEKPQAAATVQPVASSSNEEHGIRHRPDRDVRNAVWAIVTGVALPCIPILVILAVLLYFIYHHKINPWAGYPELGLDAAPSSKHGFDARLSSVRHNGGGPAYLVHYNPSTLTTIASWTSRIIPYLTSSIMALVAFFAARYIVQQSKKGDEAVLPDPEQLTILIGLLAGSGVTPLKDTLLYRWLKKERLVSPVPAVFWVLAFITILGLIIPALDTWFGIAIHPTTITLLSNTTAPQRFGRHLGGSYLDYPVCPNGAGADISDVWWGPDDKPDKSLFWPCNVQAGFGASTHVALANPADATRLQYGLNTSTLVSSYTHDAKNWFFYADPRANWKLDFMASTSALSTQCVPMTQQCGGSSTVNGPFECSSGFKGDWSKPWPYVMTKEKGPKAADYSSTGIAFAPDAGLSSTPHLVNGTRGPQWPKVLKTNPAHFGTWAFDFPNGDSITEGLSIDPEIEFWAQDTLWFLNCTITVADVTYAWVNGSIHTFESVLATPEMAALFVGAYSLIGVTPYFAEVMNRVLTNMATIVWSFWPFRNSLEQHRDSSVIVARIPLAPLYLLVGVKLIYVVAVIALAIGAYAFTHPAETEVVKAQLSTKGLAAAHFDQPHLLQENAVKAVQSRLYMVSSKSRSNTDPPTTSKKDQVEPTPGQLKRAETSPAEIEGGKPKVGIVPNADGAWKFVVLADGVWHSISPIVKSFIQNEASQGKLGEIGDVITAWK